MWGQFGTHDKSNEEKEYEMRIVKMALEANKSEGVTRARRAYCEESGSVTVVYLSTAGVYLAIYRVRHG